MSGKWAWMGVSDWGGRVDVEKVRRQGKGGKER